MPSEADIQRSIMISMQKEWPGALITRQNTGAGKDMKGNFIRFGVKGQADIRAIIGGRSVEVEVKTPTGKQSKDQKNFEKAVTRAGGIYIIARSPREAIDKINERL